MSIGHIPFVKFIFLFLLFNVSYSIEFSIPILIHPTDYVFEGKPTVVDWDGDGLVDILFGERMPSAEASDATVSFWKNSGSKTNPSFSDFNNIEADGSEIKIEVG